MKYFVFLTVLIFVCYLLGFIKKPEKYQWMDRNYTTAIKGLSILTVVWAHSGAMLSVGEIQFIAGIGVALFLMCSGYGLEISYEKNGLIGFWKKRLLGVCFPFWVVELVGLLATGAFSIKTYRYYFRLGFLDGTEGKIYTFLQAYWYRYLVDAKLYECEKLGVKMEKQGALETTVSKGRRVTQDKLVAFTYIACHYTEMAVAA